VRDNVKAGKMGGSGTLDSLIERRHAVLRHIIEHDSGRLAMRTNWHAAFSELTTCGTVGEVGGAVDVREGDCGLEEESVLFV